VVPLYLYATHPQVCHGVVVRSLLETELPVGRAGLLQREYVLGVCEGFAASCLSVRRGERKFDDADRSERLGTRLLTPSSLRLIGVGSLTGPAE
jgi:hypothetical protein